MPYKKPRQEPIAIVGSSCRFPGGASSPSKLWELLKSPTDLSKKIPMERFNIDAFYHPDGEYHGTTNSAKAYFLEQNPRHFDASFFNISFKEAEAMDPQQRLLLEVVYEALESAGYTLQQYAGKDVGVFAGVMTNDYETLSARDDLTPSQYYATGNSRAIVSNRISYFFNFHGPSLTIDTACSSSLVALHQAVLSLRAEESIMACVTGVNLILTPEQFEIESSLHMLSPTGHSRMWDAEADGYARGEGVAAVLLKPLSAALADGDFIDAIVRETGISSDGRTPGITMPNPAAQVKLIVDTYRRAGLDPRNPEDRCQYFEAHGTGTQVGDPREAAAIDESFFGRDKETMPKLFSAVGESLAPAPGPKLLVGSVKTVIGHTEGAAGLAGLLKVVQAMHEGQVAPNLHFDKLNPAVEPFYGNLEIPTALRPWPNVPQGHPRRASVNSFGFGGANAHAIVEKFEREIHDATGPAVAPDATLGKREPVFTDAVPITIPFVLSASSPSSLLAALSAYSKYLEEHPCTSYCELAWHSYHARTAFPYRLAISAASTAELVTKLNGTIERATHCESQVSTRCHAEGEQPRILGVFTGQGAQWVTMSRGLLLTSMVYADTIKALDDVLSACPDPPSWTLVEEILAQGHASRVSEAAVSQPLCTAVQIALVDLLRSLGIRFQTVVGHSSGEIAAAYAADRLTKRDAILVSYYRGLYAYLAAGNNGAKGGMLSVAMSRTEAEELCASYAGRVCIAASNSPTSMTLSGDLDALEELKNKLVRQGIFARQLLVDTAYHSCHMEAPAAKYLMALKGLAISALPENPDTAWVSSVKDENTCPHDLGGTYWADNMVKPVRFTEALAAVCSSRVPHDCVIEVGPHPSLRGPAIQTMKVVGIANVAYMGLLDRKKDDRLAFSEFLGSMWTMFGSAAPQIGLFVESSSSSRLVFSRLNDMPSYSWDHRHEHWREGRLSKQLHHRIDPPHELLGFRTRDDNEHELRWRNILKADKLAWASGHKFQGQALIPASAYCIMALDAARALLGKRSASIVEIQDAEFLSGITLEDDQQGIEVLSSLHVTRNVDRNRDLTRIEAQFSVTSAPADGTLRMKMNFIAKVITFLGKPSVDALPSRPVAHVETTHVSPEDFYEMMEATGLNYSGPFRGLQTINRHLNFASGTVTKSHAEDSTTLRVSPASIDSCLQLCFASYASPGDKALWTSFLPRKVKFVRFNLAICDIKPGDNSEVVVDTWLTHQEPFAKDSPARFTGDFHVFDDQGHMEIQMEALTVSSFSSTRPEDDYEMYLTTVMDLHPEDEIVTSYTSGSTTLNFALLESCQRVASYYIEPALTPPVTEWPGSPVVASLNPVASFLQSITHNVRKTWPNETIESLQTFVRTSPFSSALSFIHSLGRDSPSRLAELLPALIEEAHQLHDFQKHLARVAKQMAHLNPRMRILEVADPKLRLTRSILDGLEDAFLSYTIGHGTASELEGCLVSSSINKRVFLKAFDLDGEFVQPVSPMGYNLVVLSASQLETQNIGTALKKIRDSMHSSGFLILIHDSYSQLGDWAPRAAQTAPLTPPEWPDFLDQAGFSGAMENSIQYFPPGFSMTVRQNNTQRSLSQGHRATAKCSAKDKLIIIGGKTSRTATMKDSVHTQVAAFFHHAFTVESLDELSLDEILSCTAAIFLGDLDEPVLAMMTSSRLEKLKSLIRPEFVILWVTYNATFDNPDHAASFGFARTVASETPGLALQMLDLDRLDNAAMMISKTFMSLMLAQEAKVDEKTLGGWVEPEVHIKNSRRLVPRVLPWIPAIQRLNASRRAVTNAVHSLESIVEVVSQEDDVGGLSRFTTRVSQARLHAALDPGQCHMQLTYSSVSPMGPSRSNKFFVCIGHDCATAQLQVALSRVNSSYITGPEIFFGQVFLSTINSPGLSQPVFLASMLRYLVLLGIMHEPGLRHLVLIEPDNLVMACARDLLHGNVCGSCPSALHMLTTNRDRSLKDPSLRYLHPLSSTRDIQALVFAEGAFFFLNFAQGSSLLAAWDKFLPQSSHTFSDSGSKSYLPHANPLTKQMWDKAVGLSLQKAVSTEFVSIPGMISVPDLLQGAKPSQAFQLLDWTAERIIHHAISPLVEPGLCSPYKTYVLFGITRDLGQSLSRLLVEHGARNLVLASRSPPKNPQWVQALVASGVNMRMEPLDITNFQAVIEFKEEIERTMPPFGGVVNGSMVLEDSVFSEMKLETLFRVMNPKTKGSRNLDMAFDSPGLDFFIMTSSFAAIGGHAGQSNYAAANMYMNGLAASRRHRGLAGSVLNIGVIYGLGFLHREKAELYKGLERDGYQPISERDLHHMFLEAIVAGRPVPGQVADIVTGLKRFRVTDPNPLHWQTDPRFSHYTLPDEEKEGNDEVEQKNGLKEVIDAADTPQQMLRIMVPALQAFLQRLLLLPKNAIDPHSVISELGVDSLAAVDLRSWFYRMVGQDVAVMKILSSESITRRKRSITLAFKDLVL